MKKQNTLHKMLMGSLGLIGLCMIVLLVYIGNCQEGTYYQKRQLQDYRVLDHVQYSEIEDDTAALGIRKEYLVEVDNVEENGEGIAFYLVHHYVQVYMEDELVYSLMPEEKKGISETAGCRWVMIPVYPADKGKIMRVETYPAYKSVINRKTEFLEGSRYSIFEGTLKEDLPEMMLSAFAIVVGIGFTLIGIFCMMKKKSEDNLVFLGIFSVCMGIWRGADTRFMAMVFPNHAVVLAAVPLCMLVLALINFILYIERQINKKRWKLLDIVFAGGVLVMAYQVLMQATGIRDLRENLILTHVMIGAAVIAVIVSVHGELRDTRLKKNKKIWITLICFLLCAAGAAGDMVYYYMNGTSSGIQTTIGVFVMYILVMGVMEIMQLNHQANIDFSTGLFNKSRCMELLGENSEMEEEVCLIMFDLNQLKKVNDTLGHQAGDKMIYAFADILKKNIPASAFVGRYGGDEFIAVIKEKNKSEVSKIMKDISEAVANHNQKDSVIKLSYAAGCAFSSDYPGMTMQQLLKKADHEMYQNKKEYYNKQGTAQK